MDQLQYVRENRTNIADLANNEPAVIPDVRECSKEGDGVDAVIRVKLQDVEGACSVEATEQLRQQIVDLARTELFPGDEIAEFGNGELGMLLHDRHQQHVLFIAQSLQYFLQGVSAEGWEHNVTVLVTFLDDTSKRQDGPPPLPKTEKKAAVVGQAPSNRPYRIAVLSDDQALARRVYASLFELQVDVFHVETVDQANTLIDFGFSDITIIDINGAGTWPGLVAQRFDQRAEHHRVVLLCGDADETRHYRVRLRHAVGVLARDAVGSSHFPDLMRQALTSDPGHDTSSDQLIKATEEQQSKQALPGREESIVAAA